MNPRTVSLEILRHGPPHNQLLSPLTNYLALCGNHSPASVQIPFEHSQLLNSLRTLRYERGSEGKQNRDHQLKDMATIVGRDILGRIPGLIAEMCDLANPDCGCDDENFTVLRLIVSASELALIPFELAIAPEGLPGAGQSLLLQSQAPLCLTREVRRVSNAHVDWQKKPKILFAAASPGGGKIPFPAHLLALCKAVDPWVKNIDPLLDEERRVRDHLVVLPNASIASIRDACAKNDFTHVHILAHGAEYMDADDRRFGLALHGSAESDVPDVVDGVRLAAALRACSSTGNSRVSGPSVVTIASCDSSNVGSIMGVGASVAHALHENGIPLVIASQFPLTFEASVILTEVVYDGLLWNADPRRVMFCLRRDLKAKLPHSHDWSSIVAYAAFPPDLAARLRIPRMRQANDCISTCFNIRDRLDRNDPSAQRDKAYLEAQTWQRIQKGISVLNDLLRDCGRDPVKDRIRLLGVLASAEKRIAEYDFKQARQQTNRTQPVEPKIIKKVSGRLERSRDHYNDAFRVDGHCAWALVQALSMTAVLEGPEAMDTDLLARAERISEDTLQQKLAPASDREIGWALGDLIEICLLKLALQPKKAQAEELHNRIKDYAQRLAKFDTSDFVYSTRRQVNRYVVWLKDFSQDRATFRPGKVSTAFTSDDFIKAVALVNDALPNYPDVDWSVT